MSAMPIAEFEPAETAEPTPVPLTAEPPAPAMPPEAVVAPEAPKEDKKPKGDDTLDVLVPSAEPRELTISKDDGDPARVYVQKPLSYLRKMQFFKLVATTLKSAIDESGAEVVADIFGGGVGSIGDTLSQRDFDDAGGFMRLVLSVVELSEDFLEDAYVIWLAVPPGEREWAKAAMRGDIEGIQPLNDEDGAAILKTFVVQNWGAMQAFFKVHLREVFEVAKAEQRRLNQDED